MDPYEARAWRPLLDALSATRPATVPASLLAVRFAPGTMGLQVHHEGVGMARRDEALGEHLDALWNALAGRRVGAVLRASADGSASVDVYELPVAVGDALSAGPGTLHLVPGAVPAYQRRPPSEIVPPPPPAPTADPAVVDELVARVLPDATGVDDDVIDEVARRVGAAFPAELRALYRRANAGDVVFGGDEYGFRIIPLERDDLRQAAMPTVAGYDWAPRGDDLAAGSAEVQPIAGSTRWFVFGDDWGGSFYACDLVPTARGHTGQVLFLQREKFGGAELVAPSLADFVNGRTVGHPADARSPIRTVSVGRGRRIDEAAEPDVYGVSIGPADGPVDLTPLRGHPGLRYVTTLVPPPLVNLGVLATIPQLEFLRLPVDAWRELLDADGVPTTLLAAEVGSEAEADPRPAIAVANELLVRWRQDPIVVRTVVADPSS